MKKIDFTVKGTKLPVIQGIDYKTTLGIDEQEMYKEEKTEIEKLKEKVKELQKQIEDLKKNKDYVLTLNIQFDTLYIGYYVAKGFYAIGNIRTDGSCYILNNESYRDNYANWVEEGMKIDTDTVVKWRGKGYQLDDLGRINSEIYDFEVCRPIYTKDDNILRYLNNDTPILH